MPVCVAKSNLKKPERSEGREYDIRTLKVNILTYGDFGEGKHRGERSDLIALFRVLRALSPNLEHFVWNKKGRVWLSKRWDKMEFTMDILDSLPNSLKTVYAGFLLNMEKGDLKSFDRRMATFFNVFRKLESVRKLLWI